MGLAFGFPPFAPTRVGCKFATLQHASAASIPIHGLMLAFRLVSSGAALTMANVVLQSRQFAANRADAHGSEFAFS